MNEYRGSIRPGVTAYGSMADYEDFAESWMMYVRELDGVPVARLNGRDVVFSELYPNRAKYIDELLEFVEWNLPGGG